MAIALAAALIVCGATYLFVTRPVDHEGGAATIFAVRETPSNELVVSLTIEEIAARSRGIADAVRGAGANGTAQTTVPRAEWSPFKAYLETRGAARSIYFVEVEHDIIRLLSQTV